VINRGLLGFALECTLDPLKISKNKLFKKKFEVRGSIPLVGRKK
jgi:hypothetical protein